MKYLVITLVLAIINLQTLSAQIVNIPDVKFLQALTMAGVDLNNDGKIQTNEALAVNTLNIQNLTNFSDATGVEAFTNLDTLNVISNQLAVLNVVSLTKLKALFCSINNISNLDVSQNTKLKSLYCSNNELVSLDLSKNIDLINLDCGFNQITNLNLSANTELDLLECYSNRLTTLDVSKNIALTRLYCSNNSISGLDLSNTKQLVLVDGGYNKLTSLNTTGCTELDHLVCYFNRLTNLDLSTNTKLKSLDIGLNLYYNLDLSKNIALTSLDCADSKNLKYICVSDSAAVAGNPSFYKDQTAQWTENCSLLTSNVIEKEVSTVITAYPNPSTKGFYIKAGSAINFIVRNAQGIVMDCFSDTSSIYFGEKYPEGFYFLSSIIENKKILVKLIKD